MMRTKLIYMALATILSFATACNDRHRPSTTSTSGSTSVVCYKGLQDIVDKEIAIFENSYPEAHIKAYYSDANSAIDSLIESKVSLIFIPNGPTAQQAEKLKGIEPKPFKQRFAVDALAFIVNKENTLEELSVSEIKKILSGKASKWRDIEPSKLDKINLMYNADDNDLTSFLQDSLLVSKSLLAKSYSNEKDIVAAVKADKNALGIVSVSKVLANPITTRSDIKQFASEIEKNDNNAPLLANDIKVLSVRKDTEPLGVKPYQAYMLDGAYPITRSIYLISTAPAGSLNNGFLSFITAFQGQKIIQLSGLLPAASSPQVAVRK